MSASIMWDRRLASDGEFTVSAAGWSQREGHEDGNGPVQRPCEHLAELLHGHLHDRTKVTAKAATTISVRDVAARNETNHPLNRSLFRMPPPRSRGDGVRRPRPASAAAFPSKRSSEDGTTTSMESMIQAAHQHLVDQAPPSDNQEEQSEFQAKSNVRLADHMDSFPLVPLPVIPQLGVADLEKVERGLNELLGSLMPHESDQQLGRYAARQLALVQRQLIQQRAQERVFQMLRGDLPATVTPIGATTLRKSSSAAAVVKIGSTPRPASTVYSSVLISPSGSLPRAVRSQPSEAVSQHWKSKKAVEMARAMVQANATRKSLAASTTSFVVSAGGDGSRKRRRPRGPAKRSPEEETQYQAQQLERERESRRQGAYQRLMARQELQTKRKLEQKKQKKVEGGGTNDCSEGQQQEKERNDSGSDCESETSEVSNCSESDEANEKAILALDVQIKSSMDEEGGAPRSVSDDSDDGDPGEMIMDGSGCRAEDGLANPPECHLGRSADPGATESDDLGSEDSSLVTGSLTGVAISSDLDDADVAVVNKTGENLQCDENTKCIREFELRMQQHDQEEAIAMDLQHFMASRAAAKLEQLQAEKEAREKELSWPDIVPAPPPDTSPASSETTTIVSENRSSTDLSPPPEAEEGGVDAESDKWLPALGSAEPSVRDILDTTNNTATESRNDPAVDDKPHSWMDEVRQSATESRASSPEIVQSGGRTLRLPRAPHAECKDYRFYFSNFHCILTSVFEQINISSSNASSSSSLYHRPVGSTGDHTMRLQQKLYESWQSIMQDYATVFGPKIVAPEGMVPAAAAKPWAPHYRINSTARKEVSEIVTQALKRLGGDWEDHPSGLGLKTTWNLLWTWSKPRVERQTLLAWQKVNHFQHAKALTRKDCLKKHIGKYIAAGGRLRQAFDIIPPTFLLPKEYVAFVQAFQERSERLRRSGFSEGKNIWIMKPVALSRGRGISLVNDLSQVIYGEQVVIQEYIAAPRLLDGFKFDLRLYVLVTSFNPLEAFLYDEGFVRLCTRPYEDSDLSNIFVHLTNSSIQKENEEAIAGSTNPIASAMKGEKSSDRHNKETDAAQKDAGGTKTTLAYLWRRLAAEGVDVEQVKRDIEEVVLKALLCGEDQIPFQVNSFDLLGYDILLDTDLRPWLIEINSSPSMARDNDLDYQVKDAMMLDTLRVVDPLHFDRAKLAEVITRRQRDMEDEKRRPHAHTRHPREAEELAARQLNEDLTAILRGKLPRAYGEMPENIGNYRRLCPHTTVYNQLMKLKRSCQRKA